MKVVWVRDSDKITFTSPSTWFVLGLRGSAKSTFLEDVAMHYMEKDAVIFDLFGCYDDKTELLTKEGWKLFSELNLDDETATLDQNNCLQYAKPAKFHKYYYSGDMISIKGKCDFLVTPNHRMLVFKNGKRTFIEAGKIFEYSQTHRSHHTPFHVLTIHKEILPSLKRDLVTKQHYEGFVYCVSVPPNETVLVRRNGKIAWSGNSRDGESLAWLRSPYAKDKKILLVKGDNVDVQSSYPVKRVDQVTLADVENFDIIVSSSPLYLNPDQEFYSAAKLTDLLYQRLHYKRLLYLVVREAANFYYSRLKISDSQIFAKANMIYMIREARHVGIALGLDSVRYYAIDIDIRNLADYMVLKSQGVHGLASDLEWLYSFFNPSVVRYMKPQNFILISRTGALGLGTFPYHDWHKEEKEDMLATVGIKTEYGEVLHEAAYRGSFKTVSDKEHAQMIEFYLVEGMGMNQIADKLHRSTRTPHEHIHTHNEAVERSGFCPLCKRVGAGFFDKRAQRAQNT